MTMLVGVVSAGVCAIFAVLSAVHFFWVFGGVKDNSRVIPTKAGRPLLTPGPLSTAAVGVGLGGAAVVAALMGTPTAMPQYRTTLNLLTLLLVVLFGVRAIGDGKYLGFFKRERGTPFAWWDDRLFAPLCVVLSLGLFFLWWSQPVR